MRRMPVKEIHGSIVSAYKVCPRMCWYQYGEGLIPKTESTKLSLGRGVHCGLAEFYRKTSSEAGRAGYAAWVKTQEPHLVLEALSGGDDISKSIELGARMLETYFEFAANNDDFFPMFVDGEPMIEVKFVVPVWSDGMKRARGVKHVGTFDGVVRDSSGKLWLMEHKTASNFPSETFLRLDEQVGFYLLAAQQLFGEQPAGVIYNVIRKVDPKRARTPVVQRWKLIRNGFEIKVMQHRLYSAIQTIKRDREFVPSPGYHCGWRCAYTQLCVCEHDGSDSALLKEHLYIKTPDGYRPNESEEEVS